MARPQKNNADYFSHDIGMRNHRKILALRKRFGLEGYAVRCMLLEHIAGTDFFEIKIEGPERDILAGDFDVETKTLFDIVDLCVKVGLLSHDGHYYKSSSLVERLKPLLDKRCRSRTSEQPDISDTVIPGNPQDGVEVHKVKESKVNNINYTNKEETKKIVGGLVGEDFCLACGDKINAVIELIELGMPVVNTADGVHKAIANLLEDAESVQIYGLGSRLDWGAVRTKIHEMKVRYQARPDRVIKNRRLSITNFLKLKERQKGQARPSR